MADEFNALLDDILEQYDQPLQGAGEGRIGLVRVDIGFVTDLSQFPRPFYAPDSYEEGGYNEALAQARAKAAEELSSDRNPILAVRYLTQKANVLNKDTSNWKSDELQETVIAWDRYIGEDGELHNALREEVFPALKEVLEVNDLGEYRWLHLKFGQTVYPKGQEEKSLSPSEWTGSSNYPYVFRRFGSREEAAEAVEEGVEIPAGQTLHALVDPPAEWDGQEREGLPWVDWVQSITESAAAKVGAEEYLKMNKIQQTQVINSLAEEWGQYVPKDKIGELVHKWAEVTPEF